MGHSSADKSKNSSKRGSLAPLLNVPEAAALLGMKTWTMRQWLSQRRVTFIKVGRLTKLRLEDIEEFIEQNRCESVSFERRGHHQAA
jgi:excisionase family DNA binding protein